jgi:hypothetical protein
MIEDKGQVVMRRRQVPGSVRKKHRAG